jgi:hypothetical protein
MNARRIGIRRAGKSWRCIGISGRQRTPPWRSGSFQVCREPFHDLVHAIEGIGMRAAILIGAATFR